jgi:hypothetical protein
MSFFTEIEKTNSEIHMEAPQITKAILSKKSNADVTHM